MIETESRIQPPINERERLSPKNLVTSAVVIVSMIATCYGFFGFGSENFSAFFSQIDGEIYWMIALILPFPLAVLVNTKWPAVKGQKFFTPAVTMDFVYHVFRFAVGISLLAALTPAAKVFYDRFLSYLTIHVSTGVPVWFRIILVVLFADFLGWFHHYVRHRVKLFWHFHTVHHSQREMNYFTDSRVHLFDRVWSTLLVFIPAFMIQIPVPSLVVLLAVMSVQRFFYHSNLKSNFGILRYVLVTPQSHRIHHSTLPEHLNSNFGVNLSIWDHLFQTQYRNYDEYPDTGIADESFPHETEKGFLNIANTFGAQFLYPFELVYRDLGVFIRKALSRTSEA